MKKILFLVTQSELGGAQRYLSYIISSLNKKKFSLMVAAGKGNDDFFFEKLKNNHQQLASFPVQTITLKHLKRVPDPLNIFLSIKEIRELLETEKPDVLFLSSTTAGILGSIAARLYKRNQAPYQLDSQFCVIYRIGGWSFKDPRPDWMNQVLIWAERLTSRFKDKIIVNSQSDKESALKNNICPKEKIRVIYNGLDPGHLEFLPPAEAREALSEKHPQLDIGDTDKVIGCIANFYPTKGIPDLIKAANLLETPEFKMVLIGEGKQRKTIERLIKKHQLQKDVFLLGKIPQAYRFLKGFNLFVLPSLKEGFPWVILEAMAAKTPILATQVGALPEVLESPQEAILVKPGQPKELAEKMDQILKNPAESQQTAEKAQQKLKRLSLSEMVKQTEEIISSCL